MRYTRLHSAWDRSCVLQVQTGTHRKRYVTVALYDDERFRGSVQMTSRQARLLIRDVKAAIGEIEESS